MSEADFVLHLLNLNCGGRSSPQFHPFGRMGSAKESGRGHLSRSLRSGLMESGHLAAKTPLGCIKYDSMLCLSIGNLYILYPKVLKGTSLEKWTGFAQRFSRSVRDVSFLILTRRLRAGLSCFAASRLFRAQLREPAHRKKTRWVSSQCFGRPSGTCHRYLLPTQR